jgi:hypothetical protein
VPVEIHVVLAGRGLLVGRRLLTHGALLGSPALAAPGPSGRARLAPARPVAEWPATAGRAQAGGAGGGWAGAPGAGPAAAARRPQRSIQCAPPHVTVTAASMGVTDRRSVAAGTRSGLVAVCCIMCNHHVHHHHVHRDTDPG